MTFPTPTVTTEVTPTRGGFKIVLASDKFARAVYLSVPNHDGVFSDNYFDLLPGRKVTIDYRKRTPISANEMRKNLKIRSLVDAFLK
ncbi:MAG: glycoside hydrolase family 2 protein [Pyrinomonadaceae bacterium]